MSSSSVKASVTFYDNHPEPADFYAEVVKGLATKPRRISPKFFYDKKGSVLFDQICELPEYYVTRIEREILKQNAGEIAAEIGTGCMLLEPGSGSSEKVRLLLDALKPKTYVPMDISKTYLFEVAQKISSEYPWLDVHAACVDFTRKIDIPICAEQQRKVAFFPGSSIGNFEPDDAVTFLKNTAQLVGAGGGLLIGVDVKKSIDVLENAYNDLQGVTAEFNFNLLDRINLELNANFQRENFTHKAHFNEFLSRIEMHLISNCDHSVTVNGETFYFDKDESIHTECSYKYEVNNFINLAKQAGFNFKRLWQDDDALFSVQYFEC